MRSGTVHPVSPFLGSSRQHPQYAVCSPIDSYQCPDLMPDLHPVVPFSNQRLPYISLVPERAPTRKSAVQLPREWHLSLDQGDRTLPGGLHDPITLRNTGQDPKDSTRIPTRNTTSKINPGGEAPCRTFELPPQLGGLQEERMDA